jgi:hypothetical protein
LYGNLFVRIDSDHKQVAQSTGARKIADVSYVQYIKTAICKNNAQTLFLRDLNARDQLFPTDEKWTGIE